MRSDLEVTFLKPLGVKISGFDIRCQDHLNRVRKLLFENGFILFPALSAAQGSPHVHDDSSLAVLADMFGVLETFHPFNPVRGSVQVLETNGESKVKPDAFLRHADTTYSLTPSRGSVLCAKVIPGQGLGKTSFMSSRAMFHRLSKEQVNFLQHKSELHTVETAYYKSGNFHSSFTGVDRKHCQAIHPVFVKHPETRDPILLSNENSVRGIVGMNEQKSSEIIGKLHEAAYEDEMYHHDWTVNDVVMWDNYGVQHKASNDYTTRRVMHRGSASIPSYRTERYYPTDKDMTTRSENLQMFFSTPDIYSKPDCLRYEHDMEVGGYKLASRVSEIAMTCIKKMTHRGTRNTHSDLKILDVGAGSGLLALNLLQRFDVQTLENMYYLDVSLCIQTEATRRMLYREYMTHDANTTFPMDDDTFHISLCAGSIDDCMIKADAIREIVRVTKTGGFIALTIRSDYEEGCEKVNSMEIAGTISVVCTEPLELSACTKRGYVLYLLQK